MWPLEVSEFCRTSAGGFSPVSGYFLVFQTATACLVQFWSFLFGLIDILLWKSRTLFLVHSGFELLYVSPVILILDNQTTCRGWASKNAKYTLTT